MTFEIKDRDAAARICQFTTAHGSVTTPNLMPVINPNKLLIPPKEMNRLFGTDILITNSYIIRKNQDLREHACNHGVHDLLEFDGSIMTDSGTFQSYVYGDVDIDPLEIVSFQRDIGSDIGTILDLFGTPDQTKSESKQGIKETLERAKQSIILKKDMLLAVPIQGSIYPELRTSCARQISAMDADFYPIGGVVPLMEQQRYTELTQVILASKQGLNPAKPVHLFGAGHPLIFPLAVALGCDFFDSSAYAKYAVDDRMMFPWGTEKIEDLSTLPCTCPICTSMTLQELKKLPKKEKTKALAKHNLYVSYAELKRIRMAIAQGTLWQLVEQRATCNPYLFQAVKELSKQKHQEWLMQFESLSKKKALMYTGVHSIHQPLLNRTHQRLLQRYDLQEKIVILPEKQKPFAQSYHSQLADLPLDTTTIVIDSSIGPVPIELDEMYPFAQSVFPPQTDKLTQQQVRKRLKQFTKQATIISNTGEKKPRKPIDFDLLRISSVADMQFGHQASQHIFIKNIKVVKSKKTKKIRNIFVDNEHILSMRAEDGLFTLKLAGGKRLHKGLPPPFLRVVIHLDAVPFVKEGKSVFAKFVLDADPELIPGDECLIVDEKDSFLAVGRVLLNRREMLAFNQGVAVKTRESVSQ